MSVGAFLDMVVVLIESGAADQNIMLDAPQTQQQWHK